MATPKEPKTVKFDKAKKDKVVSMVAKFEEKILEAQTAIQAMGADGTITEEEQEQIEELESSIKAWTAKLGKLDLPEPPDETA